MTASHLAPAPRHREPRETHAFPSAWRCGGAARPVSRGIAPFEAGQASASPTALAACRCLRARFLRPKQIGQLQIQPWRLQPQRPLVRNARLDYAGLAALVVNDDGALGVEDQIMRQGGQRKVTLQLDP